MISIMMMSIKMIKGGNIKLANESIKNEIRMAGLYQWQVAEEMGISEATLSRKMRKELPENEKNIIKDIIEKEQEKLRFENV